MNGDGGKKNPNATLQNAFASIPKSIYFPIQTDHTAPTSASSITIYPELVVCFFFVMLCFAFLLATEGHPLFLLEVWPSMVLAGQGLMDFDHVRNSPKILEIQLMVLHLLLWNAREMFFCVHFEYVLNFCPVILDIIRIAYTNSPVVVKDAQFPTLTQRFSQNFLPS